MRKSHILYLLSFVFILASSCRFNPDMQGPGEAALQGEWQQDSVVLQKKLLNYSLYHFKFSCDSFFVSIKSFSKANGGYPDSCVQNGQWSEYAKGVYEQKHDTLRLKGLFSNADLTYKIEGGCFRSGKYEETFKLVKKADSVIQFFPTSSVIPFDAHLTKRSSCTPKPL
ncbi:fumarate hydratase [Mucilaginibacter sp.]|uniref:fumarate hydratase n=1 Tax=Mucilaginibacter sp. TaxID=1882438 RepID=UPI0032635194